VKNIDKETNRKGRKERKGKKKERDIEFSQPYLGLLYITFDNSIHKND
jgi:hypothetical protein